MRLPEASDIDAQEELARFKREAQAAGRLTHPNIVGIFDYGETDEVAYIVMEYVEGRTLKSVLDADERLPVATVGKIMADLLAGLRYSHERGVVHRDIKPANVMIVGGDGHASGQAKIADFGIARIESSNLTQAGTIMGTPAYMSPEQFMGQTVDARTDIYSAGVLLFQLLTGERPFEGSMATIMHKALHTVPPKPSDLSVTAPVALDAVVARAMARRPEDRFADAGSFAEAIAAALEGRAAPAGLGQGLGDGFDVDSTVVRPAGRPAAAASVARTAVAEAPKPRSKAPLLAGVAVLALAAAGAGGAWWGGLIGAPEPPNPQIAGGTQTVTPPGNAGNTVVAVAPPSAPDRVAAPPAPVAEAAPVAPPPPVPTTTSTQPAPPQPAPRTDVTQVVPPTTHDTEARPADRPSAPPAAPQVAQIIPPAPPPQPPPAEAATPEPRVPPTRPTPRVEIAPSTRLEPAVVSVPPAIVAAANLPPPAPVEPAQAAAPPPSATIASVPDAPATTPVTRAPEPPISAPPPPAIVPAETPAASTVVPPSAPSRPTAEPATPTVTAAIVSPEALRRAVTSAVEGVDCATVRGDLARSGTVSIQGVVGSGAPMQELQRRVREAAPTAPVDWAVEEANGPYCGALNLIRAYTRPFGSVSGGMEVGLRDGQTTLQENDKIDIQAQAPGFPSYLQVDYFSGDGTVFHVQTAAQGSPQLSARSAWSHVSGTVGPPFGTDLIVSIASSVPLFPKGQILPLETEPYLRQLRAALEAATKRRAELAAGAVVVHTSPKS